MNIYRTIQLIKPLSVNQAWQGKRFKTPEYRTFEKEVLYKLPYLKMDEGEYKVTYIFYLIHAKTTDCDNLVKPLQDCIVKKGIIKDDRFISEYTVKRIKSDRDYFEVLIEKIL